MRIWEPQPPHCLEPWHLLQGLQGVQRPLGVGVTGLGGRVAGLGVVGPVSPQKPSPVLTKGEQHFFPSVS